MGTHPTRDDPRGGDSVTPEELGFPLPGLTPLRSHPRPEFLTVQPWLEGHRWAWGAWRPSSYPASVAF